MKEVSWDYFHDISKPHHICSDSSSRTAHATVANDRDVHILMELF